MITKLGQQNKLNEETSENNMLNDLYSASEHILYLFSTIKSFWLKIEADDNMLDFWGGQADVDGNKLGNNMCNILKGTDGYQFPPGVQMENPLWIFNPAFCRCVSD